MSNTLRSYALLCLVFILPFTHCASYPIALQPDTSYQTGVQIIFTTAFSSTTNQFFFIPYTSIMTTPSVNATLGIYGINFYMTSQTFGWNMRVSSVSTTTLTIQLYVYSSPNYLNYLKLCYLVSSNPYIDVNFVEYNFNRKYDLIQLPYILQPILVFPILHHAPQFPADSLGKHKPILINTTLRSSLSQLASTSIVSAMEITASISGPILLLSPTTI